MFSKFLKKEYYFPRAFRSRIIIATGYGFTILLLLLLFTPFGMQNIQTFPERLIVGLGYSLIAFLVWVGGLSGLAVLKINKMRLFHILLFIIAVQFIIGSFSTIYNNIIFRNPYYFEFFRDLQIAVYVTGIIPTMMLLLFLETTFYEHLFTQSERDNTQVAGNNNRTQITIEDENPNKNIRLFPDEIVCVSSMDNYIKIKVQHNGEKKKPVILRSTLKKVERNISESDALIRCHKSYIVNLQWVKEISGNALAKKCVMHIGDNIIPISRSKVDVVLKKFRELA